MNLLGHFKLRNNTNIRNKAKSALTLTTKLVFCSFPGKKYHIRRKNWQPYHRVLTFGFVILITCYVTIII